MLYVRKTTACRWTERRLPARSCEANIGKQDPKDAPDYSLHSDNYSSRSVYILQQDSIERRQECKAEVTQLFLT